MTDLAFTRSEFERMVYASTNGGKFSLKYIYDTVFELIQSGCKYKLTCDDYDNDSVTLIVDSNCDRYICISMSIWNEDDTIGNIYANVVNIKIMMPFSKTENDDKGNFVVDYIFKYGSVTTNYGIKCDFKKCLEVSFRNLFSSISDTINVFFDNRGTHYKVTNTDRQPLNIQDATMQALRAVDENDNSVVSQPDEIVSETKG